MTILLKINIFIKFYTEVILYSLIYKKSMHISPGYKKITSWIKPVIVSLYYFILQINNSRSIIIRVNLKIYIYNKHTLR